MEIVKMSRMLFNCAKIYLYELVAQVKYHYTGSEWTTLPCQTEISLGQSSHNRTVLTRTQTLWEVHHQPILSDILNEYRFTINNDVPVKKNATLCHCR